MLDLELDAGHVVLTANAQRHAHRRHPLDYARLLPHVASVVEAPLYVRDDFRNVDKIELVGRPTALPDFILVAIEIILDNDGQYRIASFYPISDKKVANRWENGHLKRIVIL